MITNVCGDILTTPTNDSDVVVCHQVNCLGVMGSGLAKQIKNKFPAAYSSYRKKCISGDATVGDVHFYRTGKFIIANCFGQHSYGRDKQYTQYEALAKCLRVVHKTFPDKTIRIPYKMGCGTGGGDWDVVLKIIKDEFTYPDCDEFCLPDPNVEIWQLPLLGKNDKKENSL